MRDQLSGHCSLVRSALQLQLLALALNLRCALMLTG
jgi:hypothetical protein